jgi:hypothetical protein
VDSPPNECQLPPAVVRAAPLTVPFDGVLNERAEFPPDLANPDAGAL